MANRLHSKTSVLCLGAAILLCCAAFSKEIHQVTQPASSGRSTALLETVILSDSLDAYFPLALEIADREGVRLELGIEKAIDRDPVFLLCVFSPGALSEQVLTELGIAMRERGSPVYTGFITGSTMESARRLYLREYSYSGRHAAIDAPGETITQYMGDSAAVVPLDSTNLQQTLQNTSYLCYSGHGSGAYWRLSEEMIFAFGDLGPIPPLVVTSGACQTFRPWDDASIAMAFTDRGAAAYAGFLFSPAPYYYFGFPEGFPLRFTHPDFPIGIVMALQNRGSETSYAQFPFHFMLGDPRIYFQHDESHLLIEDQTSGDERLLRFAGAPMGFIPVRIEGGAAYSFIEIEGVAAAGRSDPFYNSRLQFLDMGKDRYILFDHAGGDFTIRLRDTEPFLWTASDALFDALDHAFVYLPTTGSILFLLIVAASVLFVAVIHTVRAGGRVRGFYAAMAAGLCVASGRGLYALFRAGRSSIVSAPVGFELRFVLVSLILAGCGAFLYFNVRSRLWRVGAVLVMTFPVWVVALFWAAGITYVNHAGAVPHLGTGIYSYTLSIMPAMAFVAECLAILLLLWLLPRLFGARS